MPTIGDVIREEVNREQATADRTGMARRGNLADLALGLIPAEGAHLYVGGWGGEMLPITGMRGWDVVTGCGYDQRTFSAVPQQSVYYKNRTV